jgi:hypothetical protein
MGKIWFCRNCGYEVPSRGRCHACKVRLSSSPLPELEPGDDEDEVGYRLQDWSDRSRSRLIVRLIEANVRHRFDGDELVIEADNEARTDDLVEEITTTADDEDDVDVEPGEEADDPVADAIDEEVLGQIEALLGAARRLHQDPTDMQADGDLAQASGTVFIADGFFGTDAATWAAIGRVTRRLLGALGAEEALEDEIRLQAGVLSKLVEPLVDPGGDSAAFAGPVEFVADGPVADGPIDGPGDPGDDASVPGADGVADTGEAIDIYAYVDPGTAIATEDEDEEEKDEEEEHEDDDEDEDDEDDDETSGAAPSSGESVYELPEWLPEQRAQLSLYLDEASIGHAWEGGDLVVALAAEDAVEALFDRIDGVNTDDDDGARYRALEELFAAADRFVNDPDSRPKRLDVVKAVANADGPTPLGLDDAQWWSIRSRARTLADSIEHDASLEIVFGEALTLRDLLRVLV